MAALMLSNQTLSLLHAGKCENKTSGSRVSGSPITARSVTEARSRTEIDRYHLIKSCKIVQLLTFDDLLTGQIRRHMGWKANWIDQCPARLQCFPICLLLEHRKIRLFSSVKPFPVGYSLLTVQCIFPVVSDAG